MGMFCGLTLGEEVGRLVKCPGLPGRRVCGSQGTSICLPGSQKAVWLPEDLTFLSCLLSAFGSLPPSRRSDAGKQQLPVLGLGAAPSGCTLGSLSRCAAFRQPG